MAYFAVSKDYAPEELRSFNNRLLRRKAITPIGMPWPCAGTWISGVKDTPLNGCAHFMSEHDDEGCLWTACSCELPGERK
jgi:hypothetical protein